jgi:hypothetical protein
MLCESFMTDNFSEQEISHDNLEPSELKLTAPELCNIDQIWTVVAGFFRSATPITNTMARPTQTKVLGRKDVVSCTTIQGEGAIG